MTETNSPIGATCYFLDNGIMFVTSDSESYYSAEKYTVVDNTISIGGTALYIFLDEYNITLAPGIGDGSIGLKRNESKIYKYNPTYDENYNIYLNAFYTSESTDNIIFTLEQGIDIDSNNQEEGYYLFNELTTLGLEISEDGEQITYNGNTYTRLKK